VDTKSVDTKKFAKLVFKNVPKEDFLFVRGELCNGCGKCVVICPVFAWKMKAGKAFLVDDYRSVCVECGACWQACAQGAINFDFPSGGEGVKVKYG